jgi:hypothetical protein
MLNKTQLEALHNLIIFTKQSFGKDFVEEVKENLEVVSHTFQLVHDLQMYNIAEAMLWGIFQTHDSPFDAHVANTMCFMGKSMEACAQEFGGDFTEYFTALVNGDIASDADEDATDPDLIPDEIYGDVDPEVVSSLNKLLKI